jgi:hypothetical protein
MGRKVAVTFILGLECIYDEDEEARALVVPALARELPAPIFALEAPEEVWANEPFSLNAWVGLADPIYARDEILADSFRATVDLRAGTITVTGKVRRAASDAPLPHAPRIERALIVGIRVEAPAGLYALSIPTSHFSPDAGPAPSLPRDRSEGSGDFPRNYADWAPDVPAPRSAQWLLVRHRT